MDTKKKVRYLYKNQSLYRLVNKVKLWPARSGILHGVKHVEARGAAMVVTTHCNASFTVWDSKHSRSARWLRNRWYTRPCPKCQVPAWKLEKYGQTVFSDRGR